MVGSNPLFVWYIIMEVINMLVDVRYLVFIKALSCKKHDDKRLKT
jgi:uncharacterized membrane protein